MLNRNEKMRRSHFTQRTARLCGTRLLLHGSASSCVERLLPQGESIVICQQKYDLFVVKQLMFSCSSAKFCLCTKWVMKAPMLMGRSAPARPEREASAGFNAARLITVFGFWTKRAVSGRDFWLWETGMRLVLPRIF